MAWEYLLDKKFDIRITAALPLIREHLHEGATIVDLDCGHAPLRAYLPRSIRYIGNDIDVTRLPSSRGHDIFFNASDAEMRNLLEKRTVRILCCFGLGGYEISKEPLESITLTQTIIQLAQVKRPSLLVIEAIEDYVSLLEKIRDAMVPQYAVAQVTHIFMQQPSDISSRLRKRVVYILEKR